VLSLLSALRLRYPAVFFKTPLLQCSALLRQYEEACSVLSSIVHWPSALLLYEPLWALFCHCCSSAGGACIVLFPLCMHCVSVLTAVLFPLLFYLFSIVHLLPLLLVRAGCARVTAV
jgi:hypothetical protein